jgi:phosphohistidine phosphatase
MATAKQLYIFRHAKSSWDSGASDDFSRPLNKRGEKDVPRMGKWMRREGLVPEHVISSPAMRARQTAVDLCQAMGSDTNAIHFEQNLYLADVDTLVEVIATAPEEANSIMLVGHNPGLEELVEYLVPETVELFHGKLLPTATLCIIELNSWQTVSRGCGQLLKIMRPKQL